MTWDSSKMAQLMGYLGNFRDMYNINQDFVHQQSGDITIDSGFMSSSCGPWISMLDLGLTNIGWYLTLETADSLCCCCCLVVLIYNSLLPSRCWRKGHKMKAMVVPIPLGCSDTLWCGMQTCPPFQACVLFEEWFRDWDETWIISNDEMMNPGWIDKDSSFMLLFFLHSRPSVVSVLGLSLNILQWWDRGEGFWRDGVSNRQSMDTPRRRSK